MPRNSFPLVPIVAKPSPMASGSAPRGKTLSIIFRTVGIYRNIFLFKIPFRFRLEFPPLSSKEEERRRETRFRSVPLVIRGNIKFILRYEFEYVNNGEFRIGFEKINIVRACYFKEMWIAMMITYIYTFLFFFLIYDVRSDVKKMQFSFIYTYISKSRLKYTYKHLYMHYSYKTKN